MCKKNYIVYYEPLKRELKTKIINNKHKKTKTLGNLHRYPYVVFVYERRVDFPTLARATDKNVGKSTPISIYSFFL